MMHFKDQFSSVCLMTGLKAFILHLFAVDSTLVSVRYVGGNSGLPGKLPLAHLSVCSTNKPGLEICVRIK